jgi:hypothetical protein
MNSQQFGNPEGDWPEDFSDENGNYGNLCIGCKKTFVGHKRRYVCKKCDAACKARWAAMTEEQRQQETRQAVAEIEAFFKRRSTI